MSRSNRHNIAAAFRLGVYIVIAFAVLVVIWQISGHYAQRRWNAEHRASQYSESANRRVVSACSGVNGPALIKCVTEEIAASREDERTEYDLKAQQDSASAAFWMAIISFLTLGTTIVALWFVKGTLEATRQAVRDTGEATEAMREANEIASETAKRQLRAYVGIESISIVDIAMGLKPTAHVVAKNFGQTPADKFDLITYLAMGLHAMENDLLVEDDPGLEHSTLPPGVARRGYPKLDAVVTPEILQALEAGARIYVFGEARYEDVFGEPRVTYFRVYYDKDCKPGFTHNCASGNHAT